VPGRKILAFGEASNIRRPATDKVGMRLLLRARENSESDDDHHRSDDDNRNPCGKRKPPELLLRCFACAGSGTLWVNDREIKDERPVRCVVCRGKGRVVLR
jgi:hypothetical protein